MLYYVDSLAETIKFHHSLLKNNGRLMIIIEKGKHFIQFTPHVYTFLVCICAEQFLCCEPFQQMSNLLELLELMYFFWN